MGLPCCRWLQFNPFFHLMWIHLQGLSLSFRHVYIGLIVLLLPISHHFLFWRGSVLPLWMNYNCCSHCYQTSVFSVGPASTKFCLYWETYLLSDLCSCHRLSRWSSEVACYVETPLSHGDKNVAFWGVETYGMRVSQFWRQRNGRGAW